MPELPEVETVVRTLGPLLCGRSIVAVRRGRKKLRRPWQKGWEPKLIGKHIQRIARRGKWIDIVLDDAQHLVVHLGMTGRLEVVPTGHARIPHTHLTFLLSPGEMELRFHDIRRFGVVELRNGPELEQDWIDSLGPEPFDLSPSELWRHLAATRRCLKAVLLDQRVVAGVGNIYADEALFQARLHPAQLGCETTRSEARRLCRALVAVMHRAIEHKGSTIRNFFFGNGESGGYQHEFRVYQRTEEPCPHCRTPIQRLQLAGRSTHYCPTCQRRSSQRRKSAKAPESR